MESTQSKEQLTLFAADSLDFAKTSALQEKAQELKASAADSGKNMPELLAKYDHNTSSWKTSQLCLDGDYQEFSETWPRSGMTQNGIAYRLPVLACPTLGIESGLLPTLSANDHKQTSKARYRGSTQYRGSKMSEGLRSGTEDPCITSPGFAEVAMGYESEYTLLETPSSPKSQKSSDAQ